jgi:uncharacterized membrane protein YdjX (TVP38/TMEM64 family)
VRPRRLLRILAAGSIAVLLLAGLVLARAGSVTDTARHLLAGLHHLGTVGWIGFAAIQVLVALSGVLPASLVGLAAGAVYGVPLGFALAAVSTMAGALLAFAISRSLFRGWVEQAMQARPRLRNLDLLIGRESWRFVCLLRISPVMPFAATSYTLGLSSVSLGDYMLGTLASLPALLGYVCLGRLAQAGLAAGASGAGPLRWTLLGLGALATVVLTLRLGRILARAGLLGGRAKEARPGLCPGPTKGRSPLETQSF